MLTMFMWHKWFYTRNSYYYFATYQNYTIVQLINSFPNDLTKDSSSLINAENVKKNQNRIIFRAKISFDWQLFFWSCSYFNQCKHEHPWKISTSVMSWLKMCFTLSWLKILTSVIFRLSITIPSPLPELCGKVRSSNQ